MAPSRDLAGSPPYAFRVVLAWRLAATRVAVRLTQAALAERLRVSRALVSAWEQGTSLPPTHRLVELAQVLGADLTTLLTLPRAADVERQGDTVIGQLLRKAAEEVAAARQECRELSAPGVIVQLVTRGRMAPVRGRPARRRDDASSPIPSASSVPVGTPRPSASTTPAAHAFRRVYVRDRIRDLMRAADSPEHRWAERDLTRYWAVLDAVRAHLRRRVALDPEQARLVERSLGALDTTAVTSSREALDVVRLWSSPHSPVPIAVRAYFARVLPLADLHAVACVDAVAQVQAAEVTGGERTGLLLDLLGEEDNA